MFSSSGSRLLMAKINVEPMSIYMYHWLLFTFCITKKLIATVDRIKTTEIHSQQYKNSFKKPSWHVNRTPAHNWAVRRPWTSQSGNWRPSESCWDEMKQKKTSAVSSYSKAVGTGRTGLLGCYQLSLHPEPACSPDWTGTNHVAQAGLDLSILLPQSPEC